MTSQLTSSNSPNALSQPLLLLFSHYVMTPGPQHARPPCPSPPPRAWLQFVSIELVMPSSHLVLCCPLSLFPSIFPSIRVFSYESALHIRWPKYWSFNCWWECKLVQPLWRRVWRFLKTLEIELPYDPAIPLLGIHTEETRTERDTCTPVFITALFIIARTWKQPRCPSADEWIRKLWYIYTMEYYSAIKKNTFESVLMRWMKLEPIIQSEVSQKEKHQYSILTHVYGI